MPKVSVVTAAYNRSNVLGYAIRSVLGQTFTDWEYLVVGDGCTDDTAEVVAAFGDPRIRFINLPANTGGQSGPHNHALPLLRGDYLMYLNQDDFWFPQRVADAVAFMEQSGAGLSWTPVLMPMADNRSHTDLEAQTVILDGVTPDGGFDPDVFIISSSWTLRMDVARQLGPWKAASQTWVSPSQDYLLRAWKRGVDMRFDPRVRALCILSGMRRNAYASRDFAEHEYYFNLLHGRAQDLARLLERAAVGASARERHARRDAMPAARRLLLRLGGWLGLHPKTLTNLRRFGTRGGFVVWHRHQVDAAPTLAAGEAVMLGDMASQAYLGFGWSTPEGTHRWTTSRHAQLAFRAEGAHRPQRLVVHGRPLRPQVVEFAVHGQPAVRHDYADDSHGEVSLALTTTAPTVALTISVARTERPCDIGMGADSRPLGLRVERICAH